jgi:ferritin-like metal-binding protein YciE
MHTLDDLFLVQLRDLYSAENQIVKALPKMAKAASSEELRSAFDEHLEQTKGHVERLEEIFDRLGARSRGKKCEAMEGLLEEGKEILSMNAEPHVRDAAMIAAAQRVEHYEIAGYGCARTFARLLGDHEAADLLQQTLDEEAETDQKLTQIAESSINIEALHAAR